MPTSGVGGRGFGCRSLSGAITWTGTSRSDLTDDGSQTSLQASRQNATALEIRDPRTRLPSGDNKSARQFAHASLIEPLFGGVGYKWWTNYTQRETHTVFAYFNLFEIYIYFTFTPLINYSIPNFLYSYIQFQVLRAG